MTKNILFTILLAIGINKITYSQIIAGSGNPPQIISSPNINLIATSIGQIDAAYLDLDCDNIVDIIIEVRKGPTIIDAPNMIFLYVLNSNFEICSDTGFIDFPRVHFFTYGDTLNNPTSTAWVNDSIQIISDYGCMDCSGQGTITDKFIGYQNSSTMQKGWIRISFDITASAISDPVSLSIPEILSPCLNPYLPVTYNGTASCGIFNYSYISYPVSCNGFCDGVIQIFSLNGGTPSYSYLWNDPASQTSSTVSNLCNGNYSVTFSDAIGNSCTSTFFIPLAPQINFSLSSTNTSCIGECDGTICCTGLSGGSGAPYTFEWSTGEFSSCISNACSGNYSFCVTDANGCEVCTTEVVSDPLPIEITFASTNNISCYGECDGSVCGDVSGGTGIYSYLWSNLGETTSCINSVCVGNYELCVTDTNGCEACSTAVITEPPLLSLTTTVSDASCATCCDGDIQIIPSGGTTPYSFTYSIGSTPLINSFCPDEYYFCVTDGNGCEICDSAIVSFTNSIEDDLIYNSFTIFPNPNNGHFTIELSQIGNYSIEIFDNIGKCVYQNQTNLGLNVDALFSDGIYIIKVGEIDKKLSVFKKLVIQSN